MELVYRYIEEHQDMYVKWLQDLCQIPSVSTQNRGIQEASQMVADFLKQQGGCTEIIATTGHPVVYGHFFSGDKKTISFYNHYDVQPEDPIESWHCDPFAAEIHGDVLTARGSADNKGALMARICAIHAYQQVYGELPINVKFIVEGEEEKGSLNLPDFIEKHPDKVQADLCIWENGIIYSDKSIELKMGTKGILYIELAAKGANSDMHSLNAAIVENPAWRLVWALSTLKDQEEKVLIDKFYDRVLLISDDERKILESMDYPEEETLQRYGLNQFLLNLTGTPLKEKLIFQPTCNICGIYSGYSGEGSKTVLPSEARAKLDFRLVPDQDPEEIVQLLREHLDRHGFEDIEIFARKGTRAAKTDPGHPLVVKVMQAAEKVSGKPPQKVLMNPGSGPMYRLCQQFGIPTVGFGVGNSDSRKHAPNENIYVSDYIYGIKMVAAVIREFA
ncbi:M20/M25/M40 family metallo-hydrolase [Paenibacillus sp. LMG 31456]|uniref:M20/M25/M40 family metallo-hydrolase n=1 Tax=Paenibacillus foliorum TaxID=2654974 RepID=A0A972K164_9BACL|nr:M20/M25/M40 family metallo-hydrolase [Paenibacillus foliorum]NOU92437.1 M20/M25/M40 family metallo-hydrolase [Paenibacillus foliorum]